ncbi:NADH-quinone oxidoreductase subunit NuoE [Jatrophihabitans sp. YIM 134969]
MQLDRPGDASVFEPSVWADARALAARYPAGRERSALLPLLHLVQSVQDCITPDGIAFCSEVLGITKAQVAAVATFYTMYKRKPVGEYLVSVCTNTLCGLMGGDDIYETVSDELGIGMNETLEDGTITLEHAECLAACDYAPVVTVNYEFFDNQTVDSTRELISQLRAGNRPLPTRGAPLCSFKETSRQIAGLGDPRPEARTASAAGVPTEIGVKLATARGESAPGYQESDQVAAARAEVEGAPRRRANGAGNNGSGRDDTSGSSGSAPAPQTGAQYGGSGGDGRGTSANDQGASTSESDPNAGTDATPGGDR